jgi:hypothetical protein
MNQLLTVLLLLTFKAPLGAQTESTKNLTQKQVNVAVDKEVELILTVADLTDLLQNDWIKGMKGGNPAVDRLINPLMLPYQKYKDHPAVIKLDTICKRYPTYPIDLPGIALTIPNFPYDVNKYKPGNQSDTVRDVKVFLALVNDFYKVTGFEKQFKKNRPIYEAIENEVRAHLPDQRVVSEMERYYGKTFASYNLTPSPLLPNAVTMGLGVSRTDENGVHIYNIHSTFAPADIDSVKIIKPNVFFGFGEAGPLRDLVVHEFGHSFINPTIYNKRYRPAIDSLSDLFTNGLLEQMSWQAYKDWRVCLAEHCVRAGEVRIAECLELKEDAERLLKYNTIDRKFIYIPLILEAYKKAEADPNVKSFEDFTPYILKALASAEKSK